MGREHSWNKKNVVDNYQRLDLARVKLNGSYNSMTITWGINRESSIGLILDTSQMTAKFIYTQTNNLASTTENLDYTIPLDFTSCYFGGRRYWFKCQAITVNGGLCGRRVRILLNGGKYFVCRHCLNLSYESRQKSRYQDPLLRTMSLIVEGEELISKLKEPSKKQYKGRPTKAYKKYCNLLEKAYGKAQMWRSVELE